jgi:dCTP deaminase
MILADREIKQALKEGKLKIIPAPEEKQIQAAWVDLKLGNEFKTFKAVSTPFIDTRAPTEGHAETVKIEDDKPFIIHPGEFVLGQIKEIVTIPDDMAAYLDGRSSLGRLGLVVHITSGWIDPGFSGQLVLEITNVGKMPLVVYPGMRICKLVLHKLTSTAEKPYRLREDAKYKDQKEIKESKISDEF